MTSANAKAQLFNAFVALSDVDQYDAVLTGLCAKLLDDTTITTSATDTPLEERLQDPMQLLQEMNQKRLVASPRSLMALLDVRNILQCDVSSIFMCLNAHDTVCNSLFLTHFLCLYYSAWISANFIFSMISLWSLYLLTFPPFYSL
jgi:hypothetical protein